MHTLPPFMNIVPSQRQSITGGNIESSRQHFSQMPSFDGIVLGSLQWIQIRWQVVFFPQGMKDIFKSGNQIGIADAKFKGQVSGELFSLLDSAMVIDIIPGQKLFITPQWEAITAPIAFERPAGQQFTRIPFSLPVVQNTSRSKRFAQPQQQIPGQLAFFLPQSGCIPLGRLHIINGDKRRLSAHGQAYIALLQTLIDITAQPVDTCPLIFAIGQCDAGIFVDTLYMVAKFKRNPGWNIGPKIATYRCSARWFRSAGQWYMPFPCKQTGSGIEPDPSGAGNVNLAPGVKIGKILFGTGWSVQSRHIRFQLYEIAGDKTCRQTEVAHDLNQQKRRIPARAAALFQRGLTALYARFHTDQIADTLVQTLIDHHQKIIHLWFVFITHFLDPCLQQGAVFRDFQVWVQFFAQAHLIFERIVGRVFFYEKIKGIDRCHISDDINIHA